jgi:hypothetical protein
MRRSHCAECDVPLMRLLDGANLADLDTPGMRRNWGT